MVALAPTGEHLGVGSSTGVSSREACLAALDDAAARTRLWRYGRQVQVAFYNPFTAQVSIGPSFKGNVVYKFKTAVALPRGGMLIRVADDAETLETQTGLVAELRPTPTLSELSRLFVLGRDSVTPRSFIQD